MRGALGRDSRHTVEKSRVSSNCQFSKKASCTLHKRPLFFAGLDIQTWRDSIRRFCNYEETASGDFATMKRQHRRRQGWALSSGCCWRGTKKCGFSRSKTSAAEASRGRASKHHPTVSSDEFQFRRVWERKLAGWLLRRWLCKVLNVLFRKFAKNPEYAEYWTQLIPNIGSPPKNRFLVKSFVLIMV